MRFMTVPLSLGKSQVLFFCFIRVSTWDFPARSPNMTATKRHKVDTVFPGRNKLAYISTHVDGTRKRIAQAAHARTEADVQAAEVRAHPPLINAKENDS